MARCADVEGDALSNSENASSSLMREKSTREVSLAGFDYMGLCHLRLVGIWCGASSIIVSRHYGFPSTFAE